jgi:type IV pilus assembly protein PilV
MVYRKTKVSQNKKGNHGYTLIEILIAMAIFSIGILAVAGMQITSVRGNAVARGTTEKTSWAADRMEELMALDYNHADLAAGEHSEAQGSFTRTSDGIDNDYDGQIDEIGETGFITIFWNVQDDTPLADTKTITVTVTRTTVHGGQRELTLTSIKADL